MTEIMSEEMAEIVKGLDETRLAELSKKLVEELIPDAALREEILARRAAVQQARTAEANKDDLDRLCDNPLFQLRFKNGGVVIDEFGQVNYIGEYNPGYAARLLWANVASTIYPMFPMELGQGLKRSTELYEKMSVLAQLMQHDRSSLMANMKQTIAEEIIAAEERGRLMAFSEATDAAHAALKKIYAIGRELE